MKNFFLKNRDYKITRHKVATFLLIFLTLFSLLAVPTRPAQAQTPVTDIPKLVWDKVTEAAKKLWQKAGSYAYQRALSAALNKIAYDTANYIGSGGKGQKPLFVTEGWDKYLLKVGDEAAGQFLESFVNQWATNNQRDKNCDSSFSSCYAACWEFESEMSDAELTACETQCSSELTACTSKSANGDYTPSFNVCQPSSLEAKVRIGLGLAEQSRPSGPNCSASDILNNWGGDLTAKYQSIKDGSYIDNFVNIFQPTSNDLGIAVLVRTDLSNKAILDTKNAENSLIANQGWVDQRDIAGNLIGTPGAAKQNLELAKQGQMTKLGEVTGDILVDTANVFLNQLAISYFNNLTNNLGKKTATTQSGSTYLSKYNSDPNIVYGETALKEVTSKLLEAKFSERADYNVLSDLSVCVDAKKPGPDECVIDTQFMQAVSEQKTVAEALEEGLLHGDWQFTEVYSQNNYSTRNLSILRKYRIIPVGWEVAIEKAHASSTNIKKATLSDLVSCFDPNDDYYRFSSTFNQRDQAWCAGLVDPNWVLKAPLNYCRKEGAGAQILSTQVIPGIKNQPGVADTLNKLTVVRADDYCADGLTCIKETKSGTCDQYGYCTEEKRTWSFGEDSCDPTFNTCQAFTNTDSGQAVAYLENTLDYGECNADSSGCKQYSLFGAYATNTNMVAWSPAWSLYLNKKLESCNSKDEGCTELARVRASSRGAMGTNLIMNSDFGNDALNASSTTDMLNNWPIVSAAGDRKVTVVDASQDPGGNSGKALKLTASGSIGLESTSARSMVPANLQTISGQAYTLSADIYLAQGDNVTLYVGPASDKISRVMTDKNVWRHVNITRPPSSTYNEPNFSFVGSGGQVVFYIKNMKFEMSAWDTGYSSYASNKIYEKLLPPYLEASCYVNGSGATKDYSLRADAPSICSNYARKCNKDEVGCELYKNVTDGFSVPAQSTDQDICPAECVGYDVYISKETYFNPQKAENLIPRTAKSCAASSAGCNEFTNLDELARGGEAKEYYTYLKQCIKPSQSACGNFYAWEGTENGYQLKAYSLQKDGDAPATTSDDSALCDAEVYNAVIGDARYNPDCREFYNVSGQPFYHLLSRTITCSEDCHAYRLTEKNVNNRLTAAQCTGSDKYWDSNMNNCYVCQNGGTWDNVQSACIYQAIPGEGQTCSASENGCREYNGNSGNNVRLAAYYNFENGLGGWYTNCADGVEISVIANNKDGHSLQYNSQASGCTNLQTADDAPNARRRIIEELLASSNVSAQLNVNGLVRRGAAYNLKFLARSTEDNAVQIYILNKDTMERNSFNDAASVMVKGGNEWAVYQASLSNISHEIGANEVLVINADKDIFFDDLILSEITDRYYLIQNSSQIDPICYYDELDNYQGADYNLGCSAYVDRSGAAHNLHQFSRLCSNSSVGCEQMIDTKNYDSPGAGIWNDENDNNICDADETDCFKVAGDSALYAIYDPKKLCGAAEQGCSRLGQAQGEGLSTVWTDVYKRNNPNKYTSILCGQEDVGCEEWRTSNDGFSYFKNPGANVCNYRASQDPTIIGKSWYKVPVKRCDKDANGKIEGDEMLGAICVDGACDGQPCIIDNNDYFCSVSYLKTIGPGGGGNQIATPDQSVGLCDAGLAGCTEYIDPVSQFSSNAVYNPGYQIIDGNIEGWGKTSPTWKGASVGSTQQVITIIPNKLYSLTVESSDGANNGLVALDFLDNVKPLLADNTFGTSTKKITLPAYSADNPIRIFFHSMANSVALVSGGSSNKTIVVRDAVVEYQFRNNIDKKGCTVTNFDNGCVLFNERLVNGQNGLSTLNWDAFSTDDKQAPVICDDEVWGSCTANTLIKVRPDRVCGKWLSCTSYAQDPITKKPSICYSVSECDRLDDKNECANFVSVPTVSTRLFDASRDRNATGYSVVNEYYLAQMKEVGLNSEAHYDFEEAIPALSCKRNVEFAGGEADCVFDNNGNIAKDSIIREPGAKATDYPAHGKSYLRVPAAYQIAPLGESNYITLDTSSATSSTYYLNMLVNTRNSGLGAKIIITGENSQTTALKDKDNKPIIFYTTANNGWERKIFKFSLKENNSTTNIRLHLTSDLQIDNAEQPKGDNYVYFDDINIEPVLEIAKDQYAARECRLYPTSDSLTCVSKDNNTIQDGLEGYCLEHDPANPGVCLLWYPVDKISATNAKPALGYTGKTPLNYCTAVDGNFTLVEKRQASKIFDSQAHSSCGVCTDNVAAALVMCNVLSQVLTGGCKFCGDEGSWCFFPPEDPVTRVSSQAYKDKLLIMFPQCSGTAVFGPRASFNGSYSGGLPGAAYSGWFEWATNVWERVVDGEEDPVMESGDYYSCGPSANEGSPDYALVINRQRECGNIFDNNHFNYCVACVPMPQPGERLLTTHQEALECVAQGKNLEVPQNSGWYKYDGFACSPGGSCQFVNEEKSADPPVRVYDFNNPPQNEDGLKYLSGNDQDKMFRLVCNQFVQVVESGGDNKAWTNRVSKMTEYPANTPAFFLSQSGTPYSAYPYFLDRYGRNREDIPFGAASWPEDFDLLSNPTITLRNQYSKKNNEDVFAGRPYGCVQSATSSTIVDGCRLIGSCSMDPSAFCLVDGAAAYASSSNYVRIETCAANGLGTCIPLWATTTNWIKAYSDDPTKDSDSVSILKTLFLKAYNNFAVGGTGSYVATTTYNKVASIPRCLNNKRPADNVPPGGGQSGSFCAVYPTISNVRLFVGDTQTPAVVNGAGFSVKKGIYRLEFNTYVDPEQQPLRRIVIDWGDGKYQVVTDQDQHPSPENKHVFYHYYSQTEASRKIKIRIYDNWDKYGSYN